MLIPNRPGRDGSERIILRQLFSCHALLSLFARRRLGGGEWWKVAISSDASTSICLFLTLFFFSYFLLFVFNASEWPRKTFMPAAGWRFFPARSARSGRTATAVWIRNSCKCLASGRFVLLPLCTGPPPTLSPWALQPPHFAARALESSSVIGLRIGIGCSIWSWRLPYNSYLTGGDLCMCREQGKKKKISVSTCYRAWPMGYMCYKPPNPHFHQLPLQSTAYFSTLFSTHAKLLKFTLFFTIYF